MNIMIDNFDFWNMEAQRYYSFSTAYKGNKKAKSKELCLSERYLGSRKMDGAWAMIIRDNNGDFHLRSRKAGVNGDFVDKADWIPHICKELELLPAGSVLLGEIYFPNNEGSRKITSVLNCLKDKCIERQEKGGWLHFYTFDVIAYNGKSLIETDFETRINKYLNDKLSAIFENSSFVERAKYLEGIELWKSLSEILEQGGEGLVITRKDCKYLYGKRTAWMTLKMKKELEDTIDAFIDGDYKVVAKLYTGSDIETWNYWMNTKTNEKYNTCQFEAYLAGVPVEPITKVFYYGWASTVSFSVMKDGKPHHIAWISGITDCLKSEIVNNPEKWIGRVAELSCMEIENIDGNYSLRHGRIVGWRDDKDKSECTFDQISN